VCDVQVTPQRVHQRRPEQVRLISTLVVDKGERIFQVEDRVGPYKVGEVFTWYLEDLYEDGNSFDACGVLPGVRG
jgi:hypothetical protein